ncbi:MAG: aminotransferase class IV, partial [Candidatus Kerfeldbacteria bacterium]|nr:aminotransferase class IV [Candidatus Kerfeldbacteria bacterium]
MRISINGKFVPHLVLTGDEPEFNFAYGVFETIRTYRQQPFALTEHLQRLRRSADSIALPITPTNETLTQWVQQHCVATDELRIKLIAA